LTSGWVRTELTVAVILSLLLLLPALAHAEGVVCEVGVCGEEDKQTTGWRDEKKRGTVGCQTLIPASREENTVAVTKPRRRIPPRGTGGGGASAVFITV